MNRKLNENIVPLTPKPADGDSVGTRADRFGTVTVDIFKEMVDKALHGIVVHDRHRPLYVNKAWAALHGLEVAEVMAKSTVIDLVHELDRERLVNYMNDRLAGKSVPQRCRYRAVHRSGRTIWLDQFAKLIDWQGQRAIMVTFIDVDDRERQVVALREQRKSMKQEVQLSSEALIRSKRELYIRQSVLDQMSDRISVVGKDYRYRMTNRANLDFRGLSKEQIFGLHIQNTLSPEYFRDSAKERLDQTFKGETTRVERAEVGADGERRYTQATTEPFRDADGSITGAIVSIRDITAAKKAEEQLRLFASVIEQISDRISVIDLDYRFKLTNKATLDHYDRSRSEIIGHRLSDIIGEDLFLSFAKPKFDRCFKGEQIKSRESYQDKDGRRFTIEVLFEPYRDGDDEIVGAVATIRDVTDAQRMSERLAYQARFDQLTGLPNRQAFEHRLEKSITDARTNGRTSALCFIDLDQFKVVNDTVGHLAGDQLLTQVANLLSGKLREGDVLARFGGDEFALLLPRCSLRRAKRAAEQLIASLTGFRFFHEDLMFKIGASIGITAIDRDVVSASDLLAKADLACYAAKDNGRNQVQIYQKRDVTIRRRQEEMYRAGSIRSALDDDRFVLYGQPIAPTHDVESDADRIEILLRMTGEQGEILKPSEFIPAAERYGFMSEIDRWVIRKTVAELATPGSSLAKAKVCINLSGVTLNDQTSLTFVRETLTDSGLAPERISFEITETAAIRNMSTTQAFMSELRDWGCRFALDDFGSGLSSLKYLKRLPVDFLKIDGSFIHDVAKDDGSRAIVRAINQMAADLGIRTVAEGVEDLATLGTLIDLGIDFVQGYAIGMPTELTS